MRVSIKIAAILCLYFCIGSSIPAQAEDNYWDQEMPVRPVDEKKWQELKAEMDYSPKKKSIQKDKDSNKKERGADSSSEPSVFSGPMNLGPVFQYLGYALLIALLVFVIFKLFNIDLFRSGRRVSGGTGITIEHIEEQIHESDLERFLREAIEQKQYKLAIRIYFLIVLKELSENNFIVWKKDKTNREYLYEMSGKKSHQSFINVVRIYEKTWYGDSTIDETQYQGLIPHFEQFVQNVRRKTQ
ncbi:MAG: hypothetical protein ACK4ND_00210 [Cytophagaceae bacterium]